MTINYHFIVWLIIGSFVGRYVTKEYMHTFCEFVLGFGQKPLKVITVISYIPFVNIMANVIFFSLVIIIAAIFYGFYYLGELGKYLKR